VTNSGGAKPEWSRDGRTLYYLSLDGDLAAAPVSSSESFDAGAARRLFPADLSPTMMGAQFGIDSDSGFVLLTRPADTASMSLAAVLHWFSPRGVNEAR
jgi:hypothetical protein